MYPCGTLSAKTHAYCNSPKPSYLISRFTPKVIFYIFIHCLLWSCIRKRTEVNKEAIEYIQGFYLNLLQSVSGGYFEKNSKWTYITIQRIPIIWKNKSSCAKVMGRELAEIALSYFLNLINENKRFLETKHPVRIYLPLSLFLN